MLLINCLIIVQLTEHALMMELNWLYYVLISMFYVVSTTLSATLAKSLLYYKCLIKILFCGSILVDDLILVGLKTWK